MNEAGALRQILTLAGCYVAATIVCAMLFVAAMNAPPFTGMPILFFRGVAALVVCGFATAAILGVAARRLATLSLRASDVAGAVVTAIALNLCFFTLGPVTVDRSISVFMLSRFERADHPLTVGDIAGDFTRIYVGEWDQMSRRFDEQVASGNLEKSGDGYRLTPRGRAFMNTARWMARLYATDPRFVGLDRE